MKKAKQILSELESHGYAVVENLLSQKILEEVSDTLKKRLQDTPFGQNEFVGRRTKRLHSLVGETEAINDVILNETILEVVQEHCGDALLSATVACQIYPGETKQTFHYDDGVYPLPENFRDFKLGVIWAIDDFKEENGATIVIPSSQGKRYKETPNQIANRETIKMPRGSALIYKGSLWHAGGENLSKNPRLGVIIQYVESWLRPQDSHLISVQINKAKTLEPKLQALLGYSMREPFLGYVKGRNPMEILKNGK